MRHLGFRQKVLILAVVLVAAAQVVTLVPVLNAVKHRTESDAREQLALAGSLLDEYLRNRRGLVSTAVGALVADHGFKTAFATGDDVTILSALENHAQKRVDADVTALLDLDGEVRVSYGFTAPEGGVLDVESFDRDGHRVVFFDGRPYQAVTVPIATPLPVAWVLMGYALDEALAQHLHGLTRNAVSFVTFEGGAASVLASTLPAEAQAAAFAGLEPRVEDVQQSAGATDGFLTSLRPFLERDSNVFVAVHLPLAETAAAYRNIRNVFLLITGFCLLLAIGGSAWLANTVTRPVRDLVAAARRMREGVYTEALEVRSGDELGELAGSFNVMQAAIADRERHIFHQAHHDSLSGLPNRELIIGRLRDAIATNPKLAVVSLGLDRFNGIVSSLGHRAGDEVVKLTAGALRNRLSEDQLLGHLSGHEFVVALPGASAEEAAHWVEYQADHLRAGVRLGGANISLQVTGGIACYPDHSADAAELCRRASSARSDALARHEIAAVYRIGQEDESLRQIKIVGDFTQALKNDDLRVYFQPKLDCRTREIKGVEALVRWQHPELGLLMPDAFVGAIEQAGAIARLTRWVLQRAVANVRAWRDQGVALTVAVNISVDDLVDEYLPYFLLDLVKRHGLTPADLTLEVTESAIMHNVHKSLAVVSCIHELGFRIAVDDFGTGQSALAQLKRLPVDELKIDKSFVMTDEDAKDRAILKATIELAHELGLTVVAEGVENDATLERLAAFGCEHAQGFGIGKPMPEADLLPWLAAWKAAHSAGVVALTGRSAERHGLAAAGKKRI